MIPTLPLELRVGVVLALYALLTVVTVAIASRRAEPEERRTAAVIGGIWAPAVFLGNYAFYRVGLMSFLPWLNNFLHTFLWIGGCLTVLYMGVRKDLGLIEQGLVFALLSFIVKVAERALFGIWEHAHFFWVFPGEWAYIVGWSLADGLYPVLTLWGIRILAGRVSGIVAV